MEDTIQIIVGKIKELEGELRNEIEKKEQEFYYHIQKKKVEFEEKVWKEHRKLVKRIHRYLIEARILSILSAPIIYSCLIPAVLMDAVISFFQFVCFPIYGIPKVQRSDYIVIDRQYLRYLNIIEKINCTYCGYFNGVVAYTREIAARTEQHWCPIKHARRMRDMHSRYRFFLDYGDAANYRKNIETIRRDFEDLE